VGGGRKKGNGEGEQIWCKHHVLVYENGKMRPVETFLRRRRKGIKENDGRGESHYVISTFVNVKMYLQYNNMLIKTFKINVQYF
jgi:hypothetical protein